MHCHCCKHDVSLQFFPPAQMVMEHSILPQVHFNRHYSIMQLKCIVDLFIILLNTKMSSFCFRIGRPRKSK